MLCCHFAVALVIDTGFTGFYKSNYLGKMLTPWWQQYTQANVGVYWKLQRRWSMHDDQSCSVDLHRSRSADCDSMSCACTCIMSTHAEYLPMLALCWILIRAQMYAHNTSSQPQSKVNLKEISGNAPVSIVRCKPWWSHGRHQWCCGGKMPIFMS